MPRMKDMPSSGAFLRSSVHPVQVGLGASPGRANSFANAPSKTPLRSTNRNHPIDLPDSSCFCHRPATVGSAACMGSVALVKAARLATSSIDNRVLNGVPPGLDQRRDGLRIRRTICPFQGASPSYPWGFEERRIGAISPRIRENLAPCGGLSPSTVEGPPRGVDRRSTIRLFCRRRSLVLPRARGNHAPPFDGCARYLRPFIIISLNAEQPRPPMSLIYRLASRNLFHDRLRFVATVVGIVFSIVLVTVQLGLYLGFGRIVTTMIDHASADLWIMPA